MCSENQDNIRYALITVVLSYTPRSFDKASTQVCLIRAIRKPSQAFFIDTLPTCSSDTLTNLRSQWNAMSQTQAIIL